MGKDKLLPVGTPVFDIRYGWGKVRTLIEESDYPLVCGFEGGVNETYLKDGRSFKENKVPTLSLTEYNLTEGWFTSITKFDLDLPKVGDWGYFWSNNCKHNGFCTFGLLSEINKGEAYCYTLKVMWLYEKYDTWIWVTPTTNEHGDLMFTFHFTRTNLPKFKKYNGGKYSSPTEAYEKAIEHVLNNLIK
jgi:hypothetical protein